MKIQTSRFGEIEVDESRIIKTEEGLLGFEDIKEYILLSEDNTDFYWIQAVSKPDLALACMSPYCVCDNYVAHIDEVTEQKLELVDDDDALLLCVVVIPADIKRTTINLRAPIIINNKNNTAVQVILDNNDYSIRHLVFEQREAG